MSSAKLDILERSARRSQALMAKVSYWRLSDSIRDFLLYMYWRNRFPVLTKIAGKAILLLEIYLIYRLFHYRVLGSLSFLLFVYFAMKNLLRGVFQYFRMKIIEQVQDGFVENAKQELYLAAVVSGVLGTVLPTMVLLAAFFLETDSLSLLFIGTWIALLPLELLSATFWMATYSVKRLRRSFSFIIFCRLLPCIVLLLCHKPLGPLSYVLGILLGRGAEKLYLLKIAKDESAKLGLTLSRPARPLMKIKNLIRNRHFASRAFFPCTFVVYDLLLAFCLWMRSNDYWLTHFVFTQVVIIFSYPAVRAAQSLSMDIYLSLKYCDINRGRNFTKKALRSSKLISVAAGILLLALMVYAGPLHLGNSVIYELGPYLALATIFRGYFASAVPLYQSAGTETSLNRYFTILFLGVGTASVSVSTLYLRGNLPFIYLCDTAIFIMANLLLARKREFQNSSIYRRAVEKRLSKSGLGTAEMWRKRLKSGNDEYILVHLNNRYRSISLRDSIVERISRHLGSEVLGLSIVPEMLVYAVSTDNGCSISAVRKDLLLNFGGHIQDVVPIERNKSPEDNISHILSVLEKSKSKSKELRQIVEKMKGVVGEEFSLPNLMQLSENIPSYLAKYPSVELKDSGFHHYNKPDGKHIAHASQLFAQSLSSSRLIYKQNPPYAVFSNLGNPKYIFDTTTLQEGEKKKLYHEAFCFSLLSSLQGAR